MAEARLVAQEAAKAKKATQMGTQIHAGDNYRRVVEIIQSGAIGKVAEVHTWASSALGGGDRPNDMPPVPSTLHWDLWLGPAPERPYNPAYVPFKWRCGGILEAERLPTWAAITWICRSGAGAARAERRGGRRLAGQSRNDSAGTFGTLRFSARGDQPPVRLAWYSGDRIPQTIHGVPTTATGNPAPAGNLFVGDKGMMFADYDTYRLFPEADFADFKPPEPTIPNSIGHHAEWVKACKDGSPTTCNFDYAGALTEAVLLANVSYRLGKPLVWDAANLKATNAADAEQFITKEYRQGWAI